jgi:hypothetical protein
MKIELTIADERENRFFEGFLRMNPIPEVEEGEEQLTRKQWLKVWLKQKALESFREGKRKLEVEKINIISEDDIIN